MKSGHIKVIAITQPDQRGRKDSLVAAVLAPMVMMIVDGLPLYPPWLEVVPLHASVQNIPYVVEYFVGRDFCLGASGAD